MMAVKLAKALGAQITVITRSQAKAEDALKAAARSLDVILSTVPVRHDVAPYLKLTPGPRSRPAIPRSAT